MKNGMKSNLLFGKFHEMAFGVIKNELYRDLIFIKFRKIRHGDRETTIPANKTPSPFLYLFFLSCAGAGASDEYSTNVSNDS